MKSPFIYYTYILVILLISFNQVVRSQSYTFELNQPPALQANAGKDTTITSGQSYTLGGNPSAMGGYEQYYYSWEPIEGLDDPTLSNPVASPTATTTYFLTLSDSHNCLVKSEVTVTVEANSVPVDRFFDNLVIFPNPSKGIVKISIGKPLSCVIVEIFSSIGQSVMKTDFRDNFFGQYILNLSYLPPGLYYIKWTHENYKKYSRLVLY